MRLWDPERRLVGNRRSYYSHALFELDSGDISEEMLEAGLALVLDRKERFLVGRRVEIGEGGELVGYAREGEVGLLFLLDGEEAIGVEGGGRQISKAHG